MPCTLKKSCEKLKPYALPELHPVLRHKKLLCCILAEFCTRKDFSLALWHNDALLLCHKMACFSVCWPLKWLAFLYYLSDYRIVCSSYSPTSLEAERLGLLVPFACQIDYRSFSCLVICLLSCFCDYLR